MTKNQNLILITIFLFSICACTNNPDNADNRNEKPENHTKTMPEWAKDATIYEVNIRQHTSDGTIEAFTNDIARLKHLGVKILWIMPIQEIGIENRQGSMGSNYSIKDYTKINPQLGTFENFKELVKLAHENEMYVILDWVANHTAWDHNWTKTNPEFYTKDSNGNFIPPIKDWEDVIELNCENEAMQKAMIDAMKFWVTETDIDGFRCDGAEMVPIEFWDKARKELDAIKPMFMLAEAESPELHGAAFDMSYSWWLLHGMNQIASGETDITILDTILNWEAKNFPEGSVKMRFTTNNDENSQNGTVFDRYGEGNLCFSVLCYTLPGMPLLYSGQEAGLEHKLALFGKDHIKWHNIIYQDFYTSLNKLKRDNKALWNGSYGGEMKIIHCEKESTIFAFTRSKFHNKILVILNISENPAQATIELFNTNIDKDIVYTDYFTKESYSPEQLQNINLNAWEYLVLIQD